MLGDSVHGGRDKGCLERDTLRDRCLEIDGGGREAFCCQLHSFLSTRSGKSTNEAWKNEEVVVCESSVLTRIYEGVDIKTITLLVLILEHIESLSIVEDLDALGHGRDGSVVHVAVSDRRHFEEFEKIG
jgi:hypothetical protein